MWRLGPHLLHLWGYSIFFSMRNEVRSLTKFIRGHISDDKLQPKLAILSPVHWFHLLIYRKSMVTWSKTEWMQAFCWRNVSKSKRTWWMVSSILLLLFYFIYSKVMQGLYLVFPCLRMESCSNEIFYLICSFVYISPWNKFFC